MSYDDRKPLINYSNNQERANLIDNNFDSLMTSRKGRKGRKKGRKGSKRYRGLKPAKGVRVSKGKVVLRIAGFSGLQKLGASELIRFVPLTKLKLAAKKFLKRSGKKTIKKKRKGRKKKNT
jgi:hypothetical protein